MWVFWLFMYVLATIPMMIILGLVFRLTRSIRVRRAFEILVVSANAALLPLLVQRAFVKPVLWPVAVLIALVVVGGVIFIVRTWNSNRPSMT
jgi:undecaprenyl pyrophosphate phosphatase UppP